MGRAEKSEHKTRVGRTLDMDIADLEARDRLIFALDVPTKNDAISLVDELEGVVSFFKVGLELLMSGGMEDLLKKLIEDKQVFVDLKLPDDVDETVRRVVHLCANLRVTFLTLSATANLTTIRAALDGRGSFIYPKLLIVSYLSSLDRSDYALMHGDTESNFDAFILKRSQEVLNAGCDGLIASGESIKLLRGRHPETIIVSPGIRPRGLSANDHKRFTTPFEAIAMGADFLVVGRPIRNAPDRRRAAQDIIAEIDKALQVKRSSAALDEPATRSILEKGYTNPLAAT